MTDKGCQRRVYSGWELIRCNRPLKTAEQREAGLCGHHLGAEKRRQRCKAGKDKILAGITEKCERLSYYGIDARPEQGTAFRAHIGRVCVNPDDLLRLLESLREEAAEREMGQ